jgi:hypothetical protein
MNIIQQGPTDPLPVLIDRATAALDAARDSAEVLEAREMARVAYDAAKSAARVARAKQAHDTILVEVHRAQAHALAIRARAEIRLAEEYDAAQARGEVAGHGQRGPEKDVGVHNVFWRTDLVGSNNEVRHATAADLGLRRDEIYEARKLRDAEAAEPGLIRRSLDAMLERGEEPTRAALIKEVVAKPQPTMPREPLWVWGRVKDFHRDGILAIPPHQLAAKMTEEMRRDMRTQLPAVIAYLTQLETEL